MSIETGAVDAGKPDGLQPSPHPVKLDGRFEGLSAFQQLIRDALVQAGTEGWPELILADATFEDWPLREKVVVDALQAWSRTGRRFTLLATRFDGVLRNQPRFVAWRKTWSHIIECRQCRNDDPLEFPSVLWSPVWAMRRLDLAHSNVMAGAEPRRRVQLRELIDERLRISTPGFPASTLGL